MCRSVIYLLKAAKVTMLKYMYVNKINGNLLFSRPIVKSLIYIVYHLCNDW